MVPRGGDIDDPRPGDETGGRVNKAEKEVNGKTVVASANDSSSCKLSWRGGCRCSVCLAFLHDSFVARFARLKNGPSPRIQLSSPLMAAAEKARASLFNGSASAARNQLSVRCRDPDLRRVNARAAGKGAFSPAARRGRCRESFRGRN